MAMASDTFMGGLGRIYHPDLRDHQFLMRTARPATAEAVMVGMTTYRRGPILDQGDSGTCVAHAWRAWLSGEPIRTSKGPAPFALYDQCIKEDEFTDNDHDTDRQMGTSVRAGAKVLTELGHVKSYLWAFNLDDIRKWVLTGQGGVVLGTNWYRAMGRPDAEGVVKIGGPIDGGHSTWLFGMDDRAGLAYIQNSWGEDFGGWQHTIVKNARIYKGCFRISYADLDRLIREDGEACTAVETLVKPVPLHVA